MEEEQIDNPKRENIQNEVKDAQNIQ